MLALKEFAVPFGLVCLGLVVWLFGVRPSIVIPAMFVIAAAMVLLHRNEEVVRLTFEPKRLLVELKAIEKNVFAKVEELRRLGEKMGELTAFNIAQLWRLAPEDPEAVRIQERDRLADTLREMGISEDKIQEITSKIDVMVTRDLADNVWDAVPRDIFREGPAKDVDPLSIRSKLTDLIMSSPVGAAKKAAKAYLEPLGGWSENIESPIQRFEEFRRTGKLTRQKQQAGTAAMR